MQAVIRQCGGSDLQYVAAICRGLQGDSAINNGRGISDMCKVNLRANHYRTFRMYCNWNRLIGSIVIGFDGWCSITSRKCFCCYFGRDYTVHLACDAMSSILSLDWRCIAI